MDAFDLFMIGLLCFVVLVIIFFFVFLPAFCAWYTFCVPPDIAIEKTTYTQEQLIERDYWLSKLDIAVKHFIVIGRKNSEESSEYKHVTFKANGIECRVLWYVTFYPYSEIGMIGSW